VSIKKANNVIHLVKKTGIQISPKHNLNHTRLHNIQVRQLIDTWLQIPQTKYQYMALTIGVTIDHLDD